MVTGSLRFESLVLRANFECSVVDDRGCRGRRLLIDNGAFLGSGITHDIVLGCSLRKDRRNRKCANSANNQKLLHRFLQCIRTPGKPTTVTKVPGPKPEQNREAQGGPEQREFVAPFDPEVAEGPLEK